MCRLHTVSSKKICGEFDAKIVMYLSLKGILIISGSNMIPGSSQLLMLLILSTAAVKASSCLTSPSRSNIAAILTLGGNAEQEQMHTRIGIARHLPWYEKLVIGFLSEVSHILNKLFILISTHKNVNKNPPCSLMFKQHLKFIFDRKKYDAFVNDIRNQNVI